MNSIKSYDTYLFDLDGTLTNTAFVWLDVFRSGLAGEGIIDVPDDVIAQHTHDWNEFLKLGVSADRLRPFIDTVKAQASERLSSAPLHDGALDMLSKLRQNNRKTGLVTSMLGSLLEPVIQQHNLGQYMGTIVAGDDVENLKPSPEGILKALDQLGVTALERVVYIGDKDTDIIAAEWADVDRVLFYPPAHQALYDRATLEALQPTAIVTNWQEITASVA